MKAAAVLSVVACFFLAACAGVPKRTADFPEAQTRALRRDVLKALSERAASLKGLRGLATVRYGSKLMGVKGETAFALRRPGEFRVDALSDFGAFASQVVLSKGRLHILWPADGKYFSGPADRGTMGRFLLVGLEPKEVVNLFLGITPLEEEGRYRIVKNNGEGIFLQGERGELTVRRMNGRFVPLRYRQTDDPGKGLYEVWYEGYRQETGPLVPDRIRAEFRDPKSRIEIRFKEIELNPELGQNVFQQRVPPGAELLE